MNFLSLSFFFGFSGAKLLGIVSTLFPLSALQGAAPIGAKGKLSASFQRNFLKAIF